MDDFFETITVLIGSIEDSDLKMRMNRAVKDLKCCGQKMISTVKFIDYFVHDILDFTLLNKKDKNFVKDINTFCIKVAVAEIVNILEDKAAFKNITVRTIYTGFDSYFVKTDSKRLQ